MPISKPFPSRFDGKCKSGACSRGGAIRRGQLIRWDSDQKGLVWHEDCPAPAMPIPITAGTSRGQGPMFDAAQAAEVVVTPPVQVQREKPAVPANHDFLSGLADALAPYLDSKLAGLLDEAQVRGIMEQVLDGAILKTVTTVTVQDTATGEARDMGLQHSQFPLLLKACSARNRDGFRLNVWLAGPAGSGKTTAARNVALALGLRFGFCGALDNPYGLLGFIDATSGYRRTEFREIWEKGGIWLWDEVDGSTPSALLPFNAGLANGIMAFPDALVPRHRDCVIIAAANTWGLGANSDYVGRLKLDAATLDRFVAISWTLDEDLEAALNAQNACWLNRVQALRKNAQTKGIKTIISPRATDYGAALLAAGVGLADVEAMTVRKAMSADQWRAIA